MAEELATEVARKAKLQKELPMCQSTDGEAILEWKRQYEAYLLYVEDANIGKPKKSHKHPISPLQAFTKTNREWINLRPSIRDLKYDQELEQEVPLSRVEQAEVELTTDRFWRWVEEVLEDTENEDTRCFKTAGEQLATILTMNTGLCHLAERVDSLDQNLRNALVKQKLDW